MTYIVKQEIINGEFRWYVYDETRGRTVDAGLRTRREAEAAKRQRDDDDELIIVPFADGTEEVMRAGTAEIVIGKDAVGHLVAESPDLPGHPYPLTPCCHASGKGGYGGVICRNCYEDVDDYFGGFAEVAVPVAGRDVLSAHRRIRTDEPTVYAYVLPNEEQGEE